MVGQFLKNMWVMALVVGVYSYSNLVKLRRLNIVDVELQEIQDRVDAMRATNEWPPSRYSPDEAPGFDDGVVSHGSSGKTFFSYVLHRPWHRLGDLRVFFKLREELVDGVRVERIVCLHFVPESFFRLQDVHEFFKFVLTTAASRDTDEFLDE